ncbi:MAG: hypothetical protein GY943_04285 [Chloroflexi bacterium]|nr:hypothetical protein [Chloroflexota bacterium]
MSNNNHNKNSRRILSFLKRSQQWLEISGYHVGDIQSNEQPVTVTSGSTIVGDIFTTDLVVSGLVCGSIVARKITIENGGQVWGDVFTVNLNLEPGGRIQGWMSSVDDETYHSLLVDRRLPDETDTVEPPEETLDPNHQINRTEFDLAAYHQLQFEIATALAARTELEHSFEQRLSDVAGDSASKITDLSNQVEEKQTKIKKLEMQLKQTQETLKQHELQIERHQNEFSVSQSFITEQSSELTELKETKEHLTIQFRELNDARDEVETILKSKLQELESQSERIHSIETAMTSSLQHSSDLEESLVRWQELAEVTEKRVNELENQLDKAHFDLQESSKLVDMLREQKQQAEESWQTTHAQLESLRKYPTRPLDDPDQASNEDLLAGASEQISQLETELADISQERTEQILWYRASLEMAQTELELTRDALAVEEEQIQTLIARTAEFEETLETSQSQLETQTKTLETQTAALAAAETELKEKDDVLATTTNELEIVENRLKTIEGQLITQEDEMVQLKTAVSTTTTTLESKQQQLTELQEISESKIAALNTEITTLNDEQVALKTKLKKTTLQLEASEDDLAYHLSAIEKQSKHLAEIQSVLIERELQLQQTRDLLKRQNVMMREMRQKAETHIRKLQGKLKKSAAQP